MPSSGSYAQLKHALRCYHPRTPRVCGSGTARLGLFSMRPVTDRMIWMSLPRATFGIIVRDGRVVDGAPYARGRGMRLIGMDERDAAEKLRRLGAEFVPIPQVL